MIAATSTFETWYVIVKASLPKSISTSIMPASPSRTSLIPSGHWNHVAPLRLFIIPRTSNVTDSVRVISSSEPAAAWTFDEERSWMQSATEVALDQSKTSALRTAIFLHIGFHHKPCTMVQGQVEAIFCLTVFESSNASRTSSMVYSALSLVMFRRPSQ